MSRRSNFYGFSLDVLMGRIGSRNMALVEPIIGDIFEHAHEDTPALRAKVREIVTGIIMGDYRKEPPEYEDSDMACIVSCVALYGQSATPSYSSFWDLFVQDIEQNGRYDSAPETLLRYLIAGRPLVGKTIDTGWEIYAYFTHDEARMLFDFIRSEPQFRFEGLEFLFDDADEWMRQIEAGGQDVWYFAS